MYDIRYNKFFEELMKYEGGYVNDQDDPGGETKYGISKNAYPNINIAELTIDEAKEIFFHDYYIPLNIAAFVCDNLAWHVFDMGVNAGKAKAAKILQKIVGAFPDGNIGIKTMRAVELFQGEFPLWVYYLSQRLIHYMMVTEKKPRMLIYLKGWILRAMRL
jgi:lysozyme family protein